MGRLTEEDLTAISDLYETLRSYGASGPEAIAAVIDEAAARTSRQVPEWRPEVVAFANLMEAKLRENDHKGGWKTEDAEDLFGRLGAECVELSEAIGLWRIQDDWRSAALHLPACRKNVAREAADVANFAMMIADVCGALPAPPASQIKEG